MKVADVKLEIVYNEINDVNNCNSGFSLVHLPIGIGPSFSAVIKSMSDVQKSGILTNSLFASAGR